MKPGGVKPPAAKAEVEPSEIMAPLVAAIDENCSSVAAI